MEASNRLQPPQKKKTTAGKGTSPTSSGPDYVHVECRFPNALIGPDKWFIRHLLISLKPGEMNLGLTFADAIIFAAVPA